MITKCPYYEWHRLDTTGHSIPCFMCAELGLLGGSDVVIGSGVYATEPLAGVAHELWAAAQLTHGEGIEDAVSRIIDILGEMQKERLWHV